MAERGIGRRPEHLSAVPAPGGTPVVDAGELLHEVAEPRAWSNRAAVRHTSTSTSCATSSACAGSRNTRRISPYTRGATRS